MNKLPGSFEAMLLESKLPVLVDFWADWCGPCKSSEPSIKMLAKEFRGKLLIVKVNVDEKPSIAAAYGIRSIPAFLLFAQGKIIWSKTGALPYNILKEEVGKQLFAVDSLV